MQLCFRYCAVFRCRPSSKVDAVFDRVVGGVDGPHGCNIGAFLHRLQRFGHRRVRVGIFCRGMWRDFVGVL